jgi:radical SAM-linked protein
LRPREPRAEELITLALGSALVREQPEQQAPPVQRLRIRYAKRGRLRFASHRDFSRAFERALVRAGIPMAYSSGFSPHPRISYAAAAPTGAASEAEYLEIGLATETDPDDVRRRLDESLPPGLDVLEVVVAVPGRSGLADRLTGSVWRLQLPGVPATEAAAAVERFLAEEEVLVERMTKRGERSFDCRAAVVSLTVGPDDPAGEVPCAILDLVLRHGTPSVRPDDVLAGLREVSGLEHTGSALAGRVAQGPLDERSGTVGDPLAPDRDAV